MSNLEPKHTLFDSIEEMLAPETLSGLFSQAVTRVDIQSIDAHHGVAGGKLSYINTDVGRLVLKQMSPAYDWIMLSSDDQHCRSVTLWKYGLLDQLRPHLEHKTIACGLVNDSWLILMDDLTEHVFDESKPLTAEIVPAFLDALARMHATFWNDLRLQDPRLGLCNEVQLLDMSTPPTAQKYQYISMGWIPKAVREGCEVLEEFLDTDVYAHVQQLFANPQPLIKALKRYPFTLLHGDYRDANLAHQAPEQVIAFDWQEAACSLMTIDLAWFIKDLQGYAFDERVQTEAIRIYRQSLETYLGQPFRDTVWQAMIELGILVDALRTLCFHAWFSKYAENPEERTIFELKLSKRNQQIRDGMRWL